MKESGGNENTPVIEKVTALAGPLCENAGIELVELQYRREASGWVLRLFIDKTGGVTLDDCGMISRELGGILEVEDPIGHPYSLEVSSPGLDRPLKTKRDFERAAGRRVRITLREPLGKSDVVLGVLEAVSEDALTLCMKNMQKKEIALDAVAKARLDF